jgi:hypothetical protein
LFACEAFSLPRLRKFLAHSYSMLYRCLARSFLSLAVAFTLLPRRPGQVNVTREEAEV